MKILALDLGKFNTMCCFFDTKTRKHEFLNATTERNYLTTVFTKHQIDLVVMEACGPSGWINDLAVSLGIKTLVCSTNEDAWKWSNVKRKTDKDDALKLARLAAMRELKAVHMPCEAHREFRSLVKYRKTLAVALARKIAVLAWALLRDEKDWDSQTMIQVTESFGRMNPGLKESLQSMQPKENSDQRKKRLRKEAREAKASAPKTSALSRNRS